MDPISFALCHQREKRKWGPSGRLQPSPPQPLASESAAQHSRHKTTPRKTTPHRTAPHRTAPHKTSYHILLFLQLFPNFPYFQSQHISPLLKIQECTISASKEEIVQYREPAFVSLSRRLRHNISQTTTTTTRPPFHFSSLR